MLRAHSIVRSAGKTGVALILALIAGCSSTQYYGEWQEPRPILIPYSKMLIVADTPYTELKQALEEQIYDGTIGGGTFATTPGKLESGSGGTSEEALVVMLEESFADALLLVRFIHPQDKSQQIDITPAVDPDEQGPALPPLAGQSAIVDATVYDISGNGRAVYIIDIETIFRDRGADTIEYAASDIGNIIVGELKNAKVIDD